MKISQGTNIVRNTRRVDPCYAPVGALMVVGDSLRRATLRGCAASLAPGWIVRAPSGRFASLLMGVSSQESHVYPTSSNLISADAQIPNHSRCTQPRIAVMDTRRFLWCVTRSNYRYPQGPPHPRPFTNPAKLVRRALTEKGCNSLANHERHQIHEKGLFPQDLMSIPAKE